MIVLNGAELTQKGRFGVTLRSGRLTVTIVKFRVVQAVVIVKVLAWPCASLRLKTMTG